MVLIFLPHLSVFHNEKYPQRKTFLFEEQTNVYLLKEKQFIEMFYLNTIEQLFLFVEQLDQLEVCLPYSRLLAGIPMLVVFHKVEFK